MATTGRGEESEKRSEEKGREEKRKREEDSVTGLKKKRRRDNSGLEEPTPGCSGDPGSSGPYARLNISRFNIHQVLGRGAFGKVVLASVPGSNINVAVKMITKRDNEDTILRERRILLAARHCPFLCHLYDAHQSRHRAYFIMEYLSGGSVEDLIRMCGCLNIGNVRFYTAEMVSGLQFLHGHNIVHRDLKPDNIMLDADGHIRIIDLGLAQDGVSSSKNISGVTGTFHYMAPEVHRRKRYGAAVDWWSLGIVVFRMAAGRYPFYNGPVMQMAFKSIINEKPKFPTWLDADVKHLIKKLLRKDPQTRLGVSGNIREHPFFTTIGWEDLEERRVEPPFTPFRPVLENHHLQWLEHTVLHPVAGFTYVSPSWARWMKRSGL
ncbi:protein kinase C delta type-like [Ranitomeya variabilis]|uniref:protein kinase C delta type-like n=1 Tax=Ranitomeya variabilis TaxID=490064 RepID=UPI0040579047